MSERIAFQFDDSLDYQLQAVKCAVRLFQGLSKRADGIYRSGCICKAGENDPVKNNGLPADSALAKRNNFTIICYGR